MLKAMLKKCSVWFISFGLSFLIESFGWAEQGEAFFFIFLGAIGLGLTLAFIICYLLRVKGKELGVIPVIIVAIVGGLIAIMLFATWIATKLINVNYYVAFQLITFGITLGQCLQFPSRKFD